MKATVKMIAAIAALNPAGFTIDANSMNPINEGYAVAISDTQNSFGTTGIKNVLKAIESGKANAIGGWYDEQSGLYYYDATLVVKDLDQAIRIGLENNQLAIFDLNNLQEIRLQESETTVAA